MLQRIMQGHSHLEGETIERVRLYETFSKIAFLGRRRWVFTRIVTLSGAQLGDRVLDIGCGGGYLARLLAAAVTPNGRVTGVDPSSPAITYARRRGPGNCSFAVGVAQELDLPDCSFDVVTSTLAVHHIPEPERPAAFREMYRVMRPAGVCWSRTSTRRAYGASCIPAATPCATATSTCSATWPCRPDSMSSQTATCP
jgi:ubiquinone/menaquinone biosynthesis C-methylase UbiE